ncbi:MAG: hypothetical protein BGO69_10930 [Bacteroidetes bacterium 46-16]|nr:MAG: hypothetical protein BGO69_10930 [Bacteroidetes bacterium 46-16]
MRLMPFTDAAYRKVLDVGYKYIMVGKKALTSNPILCDRPLKMLKAVRECGEIPDDWLCEPTTSEVVRGILADTQTDYFIILTGDDDTVSS